MFGCGSLCCARRYRIMKSLIVLAVTTLALVSTSSADAKGCIKGAIVGGVAGHYVAHHGMLGAAAGCLYGRHRANEQQRRQQQTQGQAKDAQVKMKGCPNLFGNL